MANRNRRNAKRYDDDKKRKFSKRNDRGEDRTTRSKGSSSRRDHDDKVDLTLPQKHEEYNNIAHYIRDNVILEQASQLSFQNFQGATPVDEYKVPTIMRLYMQPTPGLTYQGAAPNIVHPKRSGINMASMKMFNQLSMSSGRNMAYAPQDIAMLILALGQFYAMDSFVRRLFGTVNLWNNYNRMFPRAAVEAMGIDYDDFVTNYSDYRTRYNAILASINQLPLLLNCGYLEKSLTQYSYLFTDDESPLAQIYMYLPKSTWILDETSYSGGTICATTQVCNPSSTRTFTDLLINVIRPMVNALIESSTLNLVYADLLNLSTKVSNLKFFTVPFIEDGIATIPIHNYEALLHIHNMTILGQEPSLPTLDSGIYTPLNDVYPDPGDNMVIYNPCYPKATITTDKVPEHIVVDSPTPMPDAATRIEMTRYKATYTNNFMTNGGITYLTYVVVPDYVCVLGDIVRYDYTDAIPFRTLVENSYYFANYTQVITDKSQFDWAPIVTPFNYLNAKLTQVEGDLNYYTVVDRAYLEKLNVVIYLGLFELY